MAFADYYQVREWLESFIPLVYGKEELGLARIGHLLSLLGNPHKKFKSIHVAGTSGKGSTCWYIAKLLASSQLTVDSSRKLKVGLHVSPHLVDIRERMQIFSSPRHPGGSETTDRISNKRDSIAEFTVSLSNPLQNDDSLMPMGRFLRLFGEIRPVVEKIKREKSQLTPSYFEILVAAAFLYFAKVQVDWAVVEVGMGGRLDATNVLLPEVSVITNVGLDHTEILGKTIEQIAREKAGIIKTDVPIVTGCPSTSHRRTSFARGRSGSASPRYYSGSSSGRAARVIADVARKRQAPLITVNTQDRILANKLLAIETVNLVLSLRGSGEAGDAAISSLKRDRFTKFTSSSLKTRQNLNDLNKKEILLRQLADQNDRGEGLVMTELGFPGRFEAIDQDVILDGAHNPDKIRFLIDFLRAQREVSAKTITNSKVSSHSVRTINEVILVVGFKKGKDWKRMVDLLLRNLPVKQVIATKFYAVTDMGRFAAVEPEEIRDYVAKVHSVQCTVYSNSQEAVFASISRCVNVNHTRCVVLVTGSLYLVGEVRTMWKLPEF